MGTSRSLLPLRLPAAAGALLALFLLAGSLADYPLSWPSMTRRIFSAGSLPPSASTPPGWGSPPPA